MFDQHAQLWNTTHRHHRIKNQQECKASGRAKENIYYREAHFLLFCLKNKFTVPFDSVLLALFLLAALSFDSKLFSSTNESWMNIQNCSKMRILQQSEYHQQKKNAKPKSREKNESVAIKIWWRQSVNNFVRIWHTALTICINKWIKLSFGVLSALHFCCCFRSTSSSQISVSCRTLLCKCYA